MVWIRYGSLFMLLGIGLGAFGAHALKGMLSSNAQQSYQTGVLYQLIHGLGLLAVGWLSHIKAAEPLIQTAGVAFILGIVLFSGSLYILSITGVKKWGMVTPIGGISFLIGWCCLAIAAK